MKTIKVFSIIIVVLFISLVNVFSTSAGNTTLSKPIIATRYQVNIHFNMDLSLCNIYMVEIVDENGRLVNAPQPFRPGISVYFFSERGPVTGTRTAKLVIGYEPEYAVCPNQIFTSPFSITGIFLVGQTYEFNLYPTTHTVPPVPVPHDGVSAVAKD